MPFQKTRIFTALVRPECLQFAKPNCSVLRWLDLARWLAKRSVSVKHIDEEDRHTQSIVIRGALEVAAPKSATFRRKRVEGSRESNQPSETDGTFIVQQSKVWVACLYGIGIFCRCS